MFLRNTNVNPSMLPSPLDVVAKKDDVLFFRRQAVQDQYNRFRDFNLTEIGQVVCALVDPMISQCDRVLAMTSVDLGMTVEQTKEYQDTVKGERRVWLRLKLEPDRLRKQLEELEELIGKPSDKPGWKDRKKSSKKEIVTPPAAVV